MENWLSCMQVWSAKKGVLASTRLSVPLPNHSLECSTRDFSPTSTARADIQSSHRQSRSSNSIRAVCGATPIDSMHRPLPLYQIIWPNNDGLYPWSPSATNAFKEWQPVLGEARKGV
jgi:hypothetical protein